MKEIGSVLVVASAVFGMLSLISFRNETVERIAVAMISMFVIFSPIAKVAFNFDLDAFKYENSFENPDNLPYEELAEEAFAKGICLAICDKFSLKSDNVYVKTKGFSFEEMRAEEIKITLSGSAVIASPREIRSYINEMNIGDCKVEIRIG